MMALHSYYSGSINVNGAGLRISGSFTHHVFCDRYQATLSVIAPVAYTDVSSDIDNVMAFAGGCVNMQAAASLSGSVAGRRYPASACGQIISEGRSANFIPGTVAGATASGG
jgi:hypothetical protein